MKDIRREMRWRNEMEGNGMKKLVRSIGKMGFSLEVSDPFLACMHHRDEFPEGN